MNLPATYCRGGSFLFVFYTAGNLDNLPEDPYSIRVITPFCNGLHPGS
jgi:hypothetical protein